MAEPSLCDSDSQQNDDSPDDYIPCDSLTQKYSSEKHREDRNHVVDRRRRCSTDALNEPKVENVRETGRKGAKYKNGNDGAKGYFRDSPDCQRQPLLC